MPTPKKNNYKQHQDFLKNQLKEAQHVFKNIRFFERHVGLFYTVNGTPVKINRSGMSDVWALLKLDDHTFHFEIEVKTGLGKLTKDQKKWKKFCDAMGISFFLVTTNCSLVDQIHNFLGEVKRKEGGEYANSASRGLF